MCVPAAFLAELKDEAAKSRAVLERVPMDNPDWAPHPKSMPLRRLAGHVAELHGWISHIIDADELDFATFTYKPPMPKDTAELIALLDANVAKSVASLERCSDEEMGRDWTLRAGSQVFFTRRKDLTIRDMALSHVIHHRAQLGVYLRLLDVPVPPTFGPTADGPLGM
jgi:uncharacterized damage-inducible protein DinB